MLNALSRALFEPLESSSIKDLSIKTALLLALATTKRVGDLQALAVNKDCMCFGPADCNIILRPKVGYVPKSLFRDQVISLTAISAAPATSQDTTN